MNSGFKPLPEISNYILSKGKVLLIKIRLNIGIYWECLIRPSTGLGNHSEECSLSQKIVGPLRV